MTYNRNFLTDVIFRLDFTVPSDYNKENLKEFQQSMKNIFPILQEMKGVVIGHKVKEGNLESERGEDFVKWNLFNRKKTRLVSLEPDNISLEFKEYENFDEFLEVITQAIEKIYSLFPSISSTRLGLRYINHIKLDNEDIFNWENFINESLLSPIKFVEDKNIICRHINSIELNKESYRIKFQSGMPNSVYPNKIVRKEFILDYDCFTFENMNKEEIITKVREFHECIKDMFEKSIKEELRTIMSEV